MERSHWKSSAQECMQPFVLAVATTPSLAAMRDQFIAGLGCFWNCKCGPMWFIISLDPPPSNWRREYRLSSGLRHDQPGRLPSVPEQCMVVESSARGKELLLSLVHISAGAHNIYNVMRTTSQWSACFVLWMQVSAMHQ